MLKWLKNLTAGEAPKTKKPRVKRAPRVNLPEEVATHAFVSEGVDWEVLNISVTGMALKVSQDHTQGGKLLKGELVVGEERVLVHAQVVREAPGVLGLKFQGDTRGVATLLTEGFDVELRAAKLNRVPTQHLKATEEGVPSYYFGSDGSELYVLMDEGKLLRFSLSFLGHFLEGRDGSLRYGRVSAESLAREGRAHLEGAALVQWEGSLPPGFLESARRFVENIEVLDDGERRLVLTLLRT